MGNTAENARKTVSYAILVLAVLSLAYLAGPGFKAKRGVTPPHLAGGLERDNRLLGESELERLFPDIVLRARKGDEKLIALTFDDGPDDVYTPAVLDVLKEKQVRATFFLIGNRIEAYPEVTRRIADEGHLIGNHTYTHPNTGKPLGEQLRAELERAESTLAAFNVSPSHLFRPPYGALTAPAAVEVANMGYRVALWSIDSLDWRGLTKEEVLNNVIPQIAPGRVILQHSAGGPGEDLSGSVLALPEIIDHLKQQGYTFVTMDEMFPASSP
ncbi:MAG: polysaccharide deacetylase family protein [Bacillota bacterium]|jgi:peptidoglycan/xylan/chitin deacetylase (PgdA/CDA1 family)